MAPPPEGAFAPSDARPPDDAGARGASRARGALVAVLILAAVLRAWRLFGGGYDGDEPFEILVRKAVLEHGVPVVPSGQVPFYGGILLYPGALGTWIGGMDVFWNRLPFAILGLAAVATVARTSWRVAGPWAGVAAALFLGLDPGHVQWSANVKVYGAQTLLTALAVDRWVRWVVERDDRAAWTCAAAFAAAALTHPAAAFLLPALAAGGLAARGLPWLRSPRPWVVLGVGAGCLLLFRWVIVTFDPAMDAHLVRESGTLRATVKRLLASLASHGWNSTWHAGAFAVAGLGAAWSAAVAVWARRMPRGAERLALLGFGSWLVALAAFTLVSRHLGAMYLLPSYPLLVLGAAAGAAVLAGRGAARKARAVAVGLLAVAVHAATMRSAWAVAMDPLDDVGALFGRLARDAKPGELVLGAVPHADLYTEGRVQSRMIYSANFGAVAVEKDGRRIERYMGHPFLSTVEDIRPAVEAAPRTWLVLGAKDVTAGRVSPEVREWLQSRMRLEERARGLELWATP